MPSKARTAVVRGEEGLLLCNPGSELRLGGREKIRATTIKQDGNEERMHTHRGLRIRRAGVGTKRGRTQGDV